MENTKGLHTEPGAERASQAASKLAESVTSTAADIGRTTKTEAQERLSTAASKADRAAAAAGEKLESAADALRGKAPSSGAMATAATAVADQLESAGAYPQEQGLSGMMDDVGSLIRRYPVQSLLIGVGLGYFLARIRAK